MTKHLDEKEKKKRPKTIWTKYRSSKTGKWKHFIDIAKIDRSNAQHAADTVYNKLVEIQNGMIQHAYSGMNLKIATCACDFLYYTMKWYRSDMLNDKEATSFAGSINGYISLMREVSPKSLLVKILEDMMHYIVILGHCFESGARYKCKFPGDRQ